NPIRIVVVIILPCGRPRIPEHRRKTRRLSIVLRSLQDSCFRVPGVPARSWSRHFHDKIVALLEGQRMERPNAKTVAAYEAAFPRDARAVKGQMFGHPC